MQVHIPIRPPPIHHQPQLHHPGGLGDVGRMGALLPVTRFPAPPRESVSVNLEPSLADRDLLVTVKTITPHW